MLPATSVLFWVPIFDPLPYGKISRHPEFTNEGKSEGLNDWTGLTDWTLDTKLTTGHWTLDTAHWTGLHWMDGTYHDNNKIKPRHRVRAPSRMPLARQQLLTEFPKLRWDILRKGQGVDAPATLQVNQPRSTTQQLKICF